jgi:hypothetical protein
VKRKILREDTMANAERQTSGIGPGSTDHPFYQMAIPTNPEAFKSPKKAVLPFELDKFKDRLFEIIHKTISLNTDFNMALKNPSVKDSEKVAIRKTIKKLHHINEQLMDIPDYLDVFSVES